MRAAKALMRLRSGAVCLFFLFFFVVFFLDLLVLVHINAKHAGLNFPQTTEILKYWNIFLSFSRTRVLTFLANCLHSKK